MLLRGTMKVDETLSDKSPLEVLTASGNDFTPLKVQTEINFLGHNIQSKFYSILRDDTLEEIGGGHTADYEPVAYRDILGGGLGVLAEYGAMPTRVISIGNGARLGIQVVIPSSFKDIGGFGHCTFYQLWGSQDGTTPVKFNSSDTRGICGNTCQIAYSAGAIASFRHTKNVASRMIDYRTMLDSEIQGVSGYYKLLEKMVTVKADDALTTAFFDTLLPNTESGSKARDNRRVELRNAISATVAEGNKPNTETTIYDIFEGVKRYVNYRAGKRDSDAQFVYATEGPGAKFIGQAWELARNAIG